MQSLFVGAEPISAPETTTGALTVPAFGVQARLARVRKSQGCVLLPGFAAIDVGLGLTVNVGNDLGHAVQSTSLLVGVADRPRQF